MVITRSVTRGLKNGPNDIFLQKTNSRRTTRKAKPTTSVNANEEIRKLFSKFKSKVKIILPSQVNKGIINNLINDLNQMNKDKSPLQPPQQLPPLQPPQLQQLQPPPPQHNSNLTKRYPFKPSERLQVSKKRKRSANENKGYDLDDFRYDDSDSEFKPNNPFVQTQNTNLRKAPQTAIPAVGFLAGIQNAAKQLRPTQRKQKLPHTQSNLEKMILERGEKMNKNSDSTANSSMSGFS